jgi:2-polyprenyl-6-methoxyphenol hydroxylase-like FAD-dependent oxidoreductase
LGCGVLLKDGVKVKAVDVAKTEIVLEDGESVHGDLIIAADGVHVRFMCFLKSMLTWI